MWDLGRLDAWCTARSAGYGMGHFDRYGEGASLLTGCRPSYEAWILPPSADLPFYYALADGFTVGDQYFQSSFTATDPNRLFLFSGSNGLSAGTEPPCLDDSEPVPGWTWPTMAETLEAANISWKVRGGVGRMHSDALCRGCRLFLCC